MCYETLTFRFWIQSFFIRWNFFSEQRKKGFFLKFFVVFIFSKNFSCEEKKSFCFVFFLPKRKWKWKAFLFAFWSYSFSMHKLIKIAKKRSIEIFWIWEKKLDGKSNKWLMDWIKMKQTDLGFDSESRKVNTKMKNQCFNIKYIRSNYAFTQYIYLKSIVLWDLLGLKLKYIVR